MLGRIVIALLALVGLAVLGAAGFYFTLKRPDIAYATLAARYETPASRYQDLPGGVRMHYFDEGNQNGPVVILLHGMASSAHSWDQWASRLGRDYHLIAIDLPGHGLTSAPANYHASSEALRDTLADFVRARGLSQFTLVGNSLGGRVAWQYALAFPDHVEALVLVDAAGWPDAGMTAVVQSPAFQAVHNPIIGPLVRDLDSTKLIRQALLMAFADKSLITDAMVQRYADLSRAPGHRAIFMDLQSQLISQSYATTDILAALRMPTLILWGEQDQIIPPQHGEQFRDAIQSAQLITFPGAGHMPQEEKPNESAAAVRAFLRDNLAPPASLPAEMFTTPSTAPAAETAVEPPSP